MSDFLLHSLESTFMSGSPQATSMKRRNTTGSKATHSKVSYPRPGVKNVLMKSGLKLEIVQERAKSFPTKETSPPRPISRSASVSGTSSSGSLLGRQESLKRKKWILHSENTSPGSPVISGPQNEYEKDFEAALVRRRTSITSSPALKAPPKTLQSTKPPSPLQKIGGVLPARIPIAPSWDNTVVFVDEGLQGISKMTKRVKKLCGKLGPRRNSDPASPTGELSGLDSEPEGEYFLDENCEPVSFNI